jgi:hypothetical protein
MNNDNIETNIEYSKLEELFGIKYSKKVNNDDINNIVSSCVFIPDNMKYSDKMGNYFSGFVKLVETFEKRKPNDTFKLRIYVDEIIFNLDRLFRHHRIKFKANIRQTQRNNKLKKTFYTRKKTKEQNNINQFIRNISELNNSQEKRGLKLYNNYLLLKTLLTYYKIYIKKIIENKDKKYNNIEIYSFNCKEIKKINNGIEYSHPSTFGSVIRLLPFFEPRVNSVFLYNISHALTPVSKKLINNMINDDNNNIIGLNTDSFYPFSAEDLSFFGEPNITDEPVLNKYMDTNLTKYYNFNTFEYLMNFKTKINDKFINNEQKNELFLNFIKTDIIKKLCKSRNLAGFYLVKTFLSKHYIDIFYNLIKKSFIFESSESAKLFSQYIPNYSMNIFKYGYDEYILLLLHILFVLSDIKYKIFNNKIKKMEDIFKIIKEEKTELTQFGPKKTITEYNYINNNYLLCIKPFGKYDKLFYNFKGDYDDSLSIYDNLSDYFLNNENIKEHNYELLHNIFEQFIEYIFKKKSYDLYEKDTELNDNYKNIIANNFNFIKNLNIKEYIKLFDYLTEFNTVYGNLFLIIKNNDEKKIIKVIKDFNNLIINILIIYYNIFYDKEVNEDNLYSEEYGDDIYTKLFDKLKKIFKSIFNHNDINSFARFDNLNELIFSRNLNKDKLNITEKDLILINFKELIKKVLTYYNKEYVNKYLDDKISNDEEFINLTIADMVNSYDEYIPNYYGFRQIEDKNITSLSYYKADIKIFTNENSKENLNNMIEYYRNLII